jgi:hypothetical protein
MDDILMAFFNHKKDAPEPVQDSELHSVIIFFPQGMQEFKNVEDWSTENGEIRFDIDGKSFYSFGFPYLIKNGE